MKRRFARLLMLLACTSLLIPAQSAMADHAYDDQGAPYLHFRNQPTGRNNCEHVAPGVNCLFVLNLTGNSSFDYLIDLATINLNSTRTGTIPYLYRPAQSVADAFNATSPTGNACANPPAVSPANEYRVVICLEVPAALPDGGIPSGTGNAGFRYNDYAGGRYHSHFGKVQLNPNNNYDEGADWVQLISHELGHVSGLRHRGVPDTVEGHPDDNRSIMSYYKGIYNCNPPYSFPNCQVVDPRPTGYDSYDVADLIGLYSSTNQVDPNHHHASVPSVGIRDTAAHFDSGAPTLALKSADFGGPNLHRFEARAKNYDPTYSDVYTFKLGVHVFAKSGSTHGAFLRTDYTYLNGIAAQTFAPNETKTIVKNYQAPTSGTLECHWVFSWIETDADGTWSAATGGNYEYLLYTPQPVCD